VLLRDVVCVFDPVLLRDDVFEPVLLREFELVLVRVADCVSVFK